MQIIPPYKFYEFNKLHESNEAIMLGMNDDNKWSLSPTYKSNANNRVDTKH